MTKIRIGITDHSPPPFEVEREALGADAEMVFLDSRQEQDYDPEILKSLDALLVWRAKITSKTVDQLERCRIVVRYGVGYDSVDLPSLKNKGIPFCNVPDYGTEEVADTACSMLLGLQRNLALYDVSSRHYQGDWQNQYRETQRLSQSVLGVIGVGRIGTALVNRMKAFGPRILGYDPYQPSGHEKAVGYQRFQFLEEMLPLCDMISFHCPLSDETMGMINSDFFGQLKNGSILVNTARGGLLESFDVLEQALRENRIYAAGLDVLPQEPPGNHPLIKAWRNREDWLEGRLWITPHLAFFSNQAWYEMRYKAAETVKLFFEHGILRNQITE